MFFCILQNIKDSMETAIKATDKKLAERQQIRRDKVTTSMYIGRVCGFWGYGFYEGYSVI